MKEVDAKTAVAEVIGGYYKQDMSQFEVMMWLRLIHEFGDAPVVKFLMEHMRRCQFAPKVNEAIQALAPTAAGAAVAYQELERLVEANGPYVTPELPPALALVVDRLGGWVRVNQTLPDSRETFAAQAYYRQFEALYNHVVASLERGDAGEAPRLLGLHEVSARAAKAVPLMALTHSKGQEHGQVEQRGQS